MVSSMLVAPKSFCALVGVLAALWAANSFVAQSQTQPQVPRQKNLKPISLPGKQTFASTCANCHGLDGRGGERAPNIAERPRVQQLSDAQLFKIIENGIPGTGMPAFHSLESSSIQAVVIYLRTLQGAKNTIQLPGDPVRGETIFLGKAGCAGCHMVAGKGGFIASDLSAYARTHTVEQIRNEITKPTVSNDRQARVVTATIRNGEKYTGRIRNEDNFSVQLQTLDGTFLLLAKSELETLEYSSRTLMPSDYGSTLSSRELNDIVSYLMSTAGARNSQSPNTEREFEEQ
jgi:cytochrome c oxidase cbb3-type subunit III